ncbi:MAG: lipid-A-disaccharide synthase [Gemmatimonadetes bacterium GWC2_71_10]|nr:MAG: lipid-A-disaccharide synthase [Gemmatimonadetes bacterium GWC2_71_10]
MSTVFISAGEPSGDAHAAAFAAALAALQPGLKLEGFGGPHLAKAGVKLLDRMERYTVLGLVEVVRKIPAHLALMKSIERRLARGDIKLLVLVDYPGFHLRLAEKAHRLGVPVLYYIAPQLWAWHESRVQRMAAHVTHLAAILPFEEPFFMARGVRTTYVGHPLLDRPALPGTRREHKAALGLDPARPVLGLFPGSRAQETRRLWPVFRAAARLVEQARPEVQCLVAGAKGSAYPAAAGIHVIPDQPERCFAAADVALSKSGTTTLEAALAGTPQVVAYRLHALSYFMARRLVKIPWVGLVNLVAEREVAPELIQRDATPVKIAAAALPLLDPDSRERAAQLAGIEEVRRKLGGPGAATRAAQLARDMLAV